MRPSYSQPFCHVCDVFPHSIAKIGPKNLHPSWVHFLLSLLSSESSYFPSKLLFWCAHYLNLTKCWLQLGRKANIIYPPPHTILARRHFSGRGGVIFWTPPPPGRNFITPPLVYTPPPPTPRRVFSGVGGCTKLGPVDLCKNTKENLTCSHASLFSFLPPAWRGEVAGWISPQSSGRKFLSESCAKTRRKIQNRLSVSRWALLWPIYGAFFPLWGTQRNLTESVSSQRLKGKSGSVPGDEALIGLSRV